MEATPRERTAVASVKPSERLRWFDKETYSSRRHTHVNKTGNMNDRFNCLSCKIFSEKEALDIVSKAGVEINIKDIQNFITQRYQLTNFPVESLNRRAYSVYLCKFYPVKLMLIP